MRAGPTVVMVVLVGALASSCGSGGRSDAPRLELTGRVGDIALGDPTTKVEREYTRFHVTFRNHGLTSGYYDLHHGRVLVTFDGGRVSALDVRTPYYRTKDGIGLGSTIPLGPCHKTAATRCDHRWRGFVWNAWVREKPCNCWVKVGRGRESLSATTKNFLKPWFFIDVRDGRVARFYFASRFID